MSSIKTTMITFDDDVKYPINDTINSDRTYEGFKIKHGKLYIPAGTYEYNAVGYITEIKINNIWYPYLYDKIEQ